MSDEGDTQESVLSANDIRNKDDGTLIEPKNHGPFPRFSDLLHDIVIPVSQVKKDPLEVRTLTSRKYEIVERFIRSYRWTVGDNMYPVARLLLPERDNRLYHVKESKLGDLIINIYKVPVGSKDHERIKKWKRSAENSFGRGDRGFAEICCEAIKFRGGINVEGNIVTVPEVDKFLDEFGKNIHDDEKRKNYQRDLLHEMLLKMNVDEIRYLIKIMMKLKLLKGMENSFLHTWHPDAPRLLDLVNDLKQVFYRLYNQKVRLASSDTTIQVHYPFKPQLASRTNLNYDQIVQIFKQDFYLEEKLDGERMQLHMDNHGAQFEFFSRKATNYTSLYGSNYESGSFTKYIKGCFPSTVKSIILDGEMVVFDHKRKQMLPFGFLKGSALSTINDSNETARPMFIAYDLLYLNGRSFEKATLTKRREALEKLLIPIENVIEVVKYYKISQASEIEKALRKAIEINSEGVILKNPSSTYSVAERNRQWIKVKPEYLDEFGEDVDVVIIGKTRQNKTSYMCGLREDSEEPHFVSFCSIANGISLETYNEIEQKLHGKWKDIKKKSPPQELLEFGSRLPEEWIDPTKSIVIQVKARSIDVGQSGMSYKAGTTLYNAYLKNIREDKDWTTSLSVDEYREIKSITSRKRKLNDVEQQNVRKKTKLRLTKRQLLETQLSSTKKIDVKSDFFTKMTFYVLSDMITNKERISIDQIIDVIKRNGGEVIYDIRKAYSDSNTVMVLSDVNVMNSKLCFSKGFDIIKPQWIFDSIKLQRKSFIEPDHCLLVSDQLFEESLTRVDQYGDSFRVPVDVDKELKLVVSEVASDENLKDADEEMIAENEFFYLFKDMSFHIADCGYVDKSLKEVVLLKLRSLIKLYHGEITDSIENATYIVVPDFEILLKGIKISDKISQWRHLKEEEIRLLLSQNTKLVENKLQKLPRIISDNWVENHIKNFC